MRGRARRWGAACRVGVGWERQPLHLHPRLGATIAPRPVASSPVSLFCWTSQPRSLEVRSDGSGRGWGCSARPHPTPPHPRAFACGAGHDCLPPGRGPHGADPPVTSRWAVRRDGWRFPTSGPLACPSPPAAGPGRVCLGRLSVCAALGLPRGHQAPPHALQVAGLAPNPPSPRILWLSCLVLPPSCPLTSVMSLARLEPHFL